MGFCCAFQPPEPRPKPLLRPLMAGCSNKHLLRQAGLNYNRWLNSIRGAQLGSTWKLISQHQPAVPTLQSNHSRTAAPPSWYFTSFQIKKKRRFFFFFCSDFEMSSSHITLSFSHTFPGPSVHRSLRKPQASLSSADSPGRDIMSSSRG